jgi:hypothetical protein
LKNRNNAASSSMQQIFAPLLQQRPRRVSAIDCYF